jgi:hypothetical protein
MILSVTHICGHTAQYKWPNLSALKKLPACEFVGWKTKLTLLRRSKCPPCSREQIVEGLYAEYIGLTKDDMCDPDFVQVRG